VIAPPGQREGGVIVVEDIRNTASEDYWEELRQRWGALLSYRYIGRQFSSMNSTAVDPTVRLRHDMRNAAGGVLVSALSITCPGGGSDNTEDKPGGDLVTVPNPVIHSMQILDDARDVKRIEVIDGANLKRGARFSYARAKIVDADDHSRVIALVESQGTSLGDVDASVTAQGRFDDEPIMHIEDSPDLPPLWQVFGGAKRADGHWALGPLKAELASPDAALHLGPQHIIMEAAAIDLASQLVGTDRLQMETWHLMHLARGKVGPFRVDGEACKGGKGSGRVGAQMTLVDEGDNERAVASATAVFRIVD
jgi:hypothetical protein